MGIVCDNDCLIRHNDNSDEEGRGKHYDKSRYCDMVNNVSYCWTRLTTHDIYFCKRALAYFQPSHNANSSLLPPNKHGKNTTFRKLTRRVVCDTRQLIYNDTPPEQTVLYSHYYILFYTRCIRRRYRIMCRQMRMMMITITITSPLYLNLSPCLCIYYVQHLIKCICRKEEEEAEHYCTCCLHGEVLCSLVPLAPVFQLYWSCGFYASFVHTSCNLLQTQVLFNTTVLVVASVLLLATFIPSAGNCCTWPKQETTGILVQV